MNYSSGLWERFQHQYYELGLLDRPTARWEGIALTSSDLARNFYRAMLCIRGTSHGPVSVCVRVRPSVTSLGFAMVESVFWKRMNKSSWFLACELPSTRLTLCLKEIRLAVDLWQSVFYRNGWTNRAGFWHVSFLHCVKRKFGHLQK